MQLLVRLCSHRIPAEELARKDDLTLLFSAITSWCPSYNVMWRKSAAEVLMTLSRHGLTPPVVGYIHCNVIYIIICKYVICFIVFSEILYFSLYWKHEENTGTVAIWISWNVCNSLLLFKRFKWSFLCIIGWFSTSPRLSISLGIFVKVNALRYFNLE